MRIAQVSPLIESVPPATYGGTERIVSYLTEGLVGLGHEVTLFAAGGSVTSADLRVCSELPLRADQRCGDPLAHHLLMMRRVLTEAADFDIIHFHTDLVQFPIFSNHTTPCVATLHGRLDMPELQLFFREYNDIPLVSISQSQQIDLPDGNWAATVHHGLPEPLLDLGRGDGNYLAFLGRFSPEKGPVHAIEIARRAGLPLKMAAKVDRSDEAYFKDIVKPLLDSPGVDYVGEIDEIHKNRFLGEASALLFPIEWPEPFGLAMIEAMACGTPVIAFRQGSVPEILDDGLTGFTVDSIEAAVEAVGKLPLLDRRAVRQRFEERFSARRMALDYVALYEKILAERNGGDGWNSQGSEGSLEHA